MLSTYSVIGNYVPRAAHKFLAIIRGFIARFRARNLMRRIDLSESLSLAWEDRYTNLETPTYDHALQRYVKPPPRQMSAQELNFHLNRLSPMQNWVTSGYGPRF